MRKDTRIMLVIVSVLVVVFLISRSFSYAKYASNTVWNYYLESKGFYFNTDLSTGNTDNNWDGSSITFDVTKPSIIGLIVLFAFVILVDILQFTL